MFVSFDSAVPSQRE